MSFAAARGLEREGGGGDGEGAVLDCWSCLVGNDDGGNGGGEGSSGARRFSFSCTMGEEEEEEEGETFLDDLAVPV